MTITTNRRVMGVVSAFALLLAACGSDVAAPATTIAAPAEQTTNVAETTTTMPQMEPTTATTTTATVDETSTTTSADDDGVTVTKDIVYLEMNGNEYLLDVYAPDGDGPWPVVVALHGATVYKGQPDEHGGSESGGGSGDARVRSELGCRVAGAIRHGCGVRSIG